ncbi:LysR family transcriptional regulator, glycine cleavage system transcriptional activator [Pseudosulfitobacter pseudonitzschiae]|uniref:LysR family transcriptional regulator n=1 Tax=Pseudosulfitobacter pseudonitzschiae TaxID=1402135 RepID=A0A073IYX5_9RHOB|nr:LysR family transcriptional regulator [Pseudosulfitobacter pseudonitzschiae]KEJ94835.1 LysR family transcriptional regulator [Pseudosulfitobacter pseudonitzschiae]QKS07313.1 LysR family transcriptional regulator [Pseudosulfitobacter pseudonitzschiae]SHF94698.1 LysR family transcriptional regulator, glycine cleavage system transcriptional activator [Pseudosulfitobacter pseudonitzschiae]
MRRLPPLNSIRAFEAVARCLSFSAAADELGVTTTAVSHQIRHLESYLGFKLIVRNPRDIALTPAGAEMFPKLRDGFDLLADAFSVLNVDIEQNVLRVTTTRAFADNWLLPRLSHFLVENPKIQVELITDDAVRDLSTDRLDVAIRYGRCPRGATDNILFADTYTPIGRKDVVEQGSGTYPVIGFNWNNKDLNGPVWARWANDATQSFEVASVLNCSDESSAFEALDQGLGLLLCSNILAADRLAAGTHQSLSVSPIDGFEYYVAVNHASRAKLATKVFVNWLQVYARETDRNINPVRNHTRKESE